MKPARCARCRSIAMKSTACWQCSAARGWINWYAGTRATCRDGSPTLIERLRHETSPDRQYPTESLHGWVSAATTSACASTPANLRRVVIHKAHWIWASPFSIPQMYTATAGVRKPRWATVPRRAAQGHRDRLQVRQRDGRWPHPQHHARAHRAATSCQAVEASLKRLKTDWIDIYQLHRFDTCHAAGRNHAGTLDELVKQGKVRYAWHLVSPRRGNWLICNGPRAITTARRR